MIMSFLGWLKPSSIVDKAFKVGKAIARGVKWVAEKIEDGIDYLNKSGKYDPNNKKQAGSTESNAKYVSTLSKIRDDLQKDLEKVQQDNIDDIRSSFIELFNSLREQFENMDISRLESMIDDTIARNQEKVDEIIRDEVSIDNEKLRKIAKCDSKDERKEKYRKYFKSLSSKIERQQNKNILNLYNETLSNAHDAYNEELEKNRLIIDRQIQDISRMIEDNENQSESEDVLINNIQKKIICQLAIDAVENADE